MIEKLSRKISKLQAKLHLLQVENMDACIRPLFANPVTYSDTKGLIPSM